MIEYKTVSLADQIFEQLEASILNGTYKRGDILTEKELSATMGVSRTPIREALQRLELEDLITENQNHGGNKVIGITKDDIKDFYAVKLRLETLANSWAAEKITDEQLRELDNTLCQQEYFAERTDSEKVRDLDTEFHRIIYNASGSRVIGGLLMTIHRKLMKYRKASLGKEHRVKDSTNEHRQLYEALKEHDVEKVNTLTLMHIKHAYEIILQIAENE